MVFSNTNLKPSKLDKHFKRVYSGTEPGNGKETFKPRKVHFHCQEYLPKLRFTLTWKPLIEAFYKVTYQVTEKKKQNKTFQCSGSCQDHSGVKCEKESGISPND